jgi:sugar lactone lactonase YvrE
LAFLVLALAVVAAGSAFAAEEPASQQSELPNAADVAEGLEQVEEDEAEEQAERETPDALDEREESVDAFADISAEQAAELLHSSFAEEIATLNTDPARALSDAKLEKVLPGGTAARVSEDGTAKLLDAGMPVLASDEGDPAKVDLTLTEGDDGLQPQNPLVPVSLPETADESIEVGEDGLAIAPEGVSDDSDAQLFGDKNAFYPEVQTDTDMLVSPISGGIELFDQLRSADSPEQLRFDLELPDGATLQGDGYGGAEVTRAGETIARVPFPTAVDAQGAQVPVTMQVDSSSLVLQVSHRSEDFAYPILVDPSLVEDWYNCSWYNNCNLGGMSSWAWGDSGHGWIYHSTSCFWTCWGSGQGLYIGAESGYHGANEFGQWSYTPPGNTSYITSATLSPFWRNNYANCPKSKYIQPHDYDGLWSPSSNWVPIEQDRANDYGNAAPAGYGRALIVGLGNAGASEDKCRRDIMLGGAAVWITDSDVPVWYAAPSAPDQWTDTAAVPITGTAYDDGLGAKYLNLYKTPNGGGGNYDFIGNAERACSGLRANPCSGAWTGQISNYNAAALPNGVNWLDVYAYDVLGIEHFSQGLPVHVSVDHSAPEIAFSGELFNASPKTYKGQVIGTDGSSGAFATAQSGMKSEKIYIDGVLLLQYPSASPTACSNVQQGINLGSCKFEVGVELKRTISGQHTLKAVATDSLNHVSEKSVTLTLPKDETAPSLAISGPLKAAMGLWLAGETSVTLEAQDAETGVIEETVFVDGVAVGTPFTQECFAGGCAMNHLFKVPLDNYSAGQHTIKVLAKDGTGNLSEASWKVSVDRNAPNLTSASSPDLPTGWTPQVQSFTLNFAATDSDSGIKKIEITRPLAGGAGNETKAVYSNACTGATGQLCPASASGSATIPTTDMAQGLDVVTVKAYDLTGRVSSAKSLNVYVDSVAPLMAVGGPLMKSSSTKPVGVASPLSVTVTDFGSGVETLEVLIDGELADARSLEEIQEDGGVQQCTGEKCELRYTYRPTVGALATPGVHTIQVTARDRLGQGTTITHQATIDSNAPEVELTGPLVEAAGETLPAQTAALNVVGKDGKELDTGIENIQVAVDGVTVLDKSSAAAPSPRRHLWVADVENDRIQEFDESGELLRVFGSSGSTGAQLSKPSAVATDSAGDIWVADTGNNKIKQFNQRGELISQFGGAGTGNGLFSSPEGVVIDASGNVWVADSGNGRLQKFNQAGEYLKTLGSKGSGQGQFGKPTGIAISGGTIWVADWQYSRVVAYSDTAGFIRQFGTQGSGDGQLFHPGAIAVAPSGRVWVGDQENGRVEGFTATGELVELFGQKGGMPGQFNFGSPMGIAAFGTTLWVADTNNGRVEKWTTPVYNPITNPPAYSSQFGTLGTGNTQFTHPSDIARDKAGNLWVVDQNNNSLKEFTSQGVFVRKVGSLGSALGQFNRPAEITTDASGNVWVVDTNNHRVQKFGPNGETLAAPGYLATGSGILSKPEGIAIDPKGNIWISDTGNSILLKFSSAGMLLNAYGGAGTAAGKFGKPMGLAAFPNGNIAVADWGNNRVAVLNESGVFVKEFGTLGTGNGQFEHPLSVHVDSRNLLWVSDEGNGRIQQFSETGSYINKFGSKGSANGQFKFESAGGLTSDLQGAMWVVDSGNNRVEKLQRPNYAPQYSMAFGTIGYTQGQFRKPGGVATALVNHCEIPGCPGEATASYTYDQATWGSGPHTVSVTVTDGAGNVDMEQLRVNEPMNAVAPNCPTANPTVVSGGQTLTAAAAISGIENAIPEALEPNEPEPELRLDPSVTRSFPGVSLNELGIDVTDSMMGGGIEDEPAGAFTVGQAACIQPLQSGTAASAPTLVAGSAAVYPNAAPDTDVVIRPTASGTAIITHPRGPAAPTKLSWAIGLEPGEELVKLSNGSIVALVPKIEDVAVEEVPAAPAGGPGSLSEPGVQLEQAEHELAVAENALDGEVRMVIAPPEVVAASGAIVPGVLRITSANVVTAELPAGLVAETEAMIIRASPPAEPESICESVMARTPEQAWRVCGGAEEEEEDVEDGGAALGPWDLVSPDPAQNAEMHAVQNFYESRFFGSGATASSGSGATVSPQQKKFCREGHQAECEEFTLDGLEAAIAEELLFNIPSDGTQANAFRHSFWVALMHLDSPQVDGHRYDGIAWAIAHEGTQLYSHHKMVRNGSRMDYLNNWVGWDRTGSNDKQSCEIMLKKAALHSIFIGAKRDPVEWANNHGYQYYNPVFRKIRDNIGPDSSGQPVYAVGSTCDDIGF